MRKGNNHEFMINRKRLDFARKAANKCMHICAGMAYLLCGWDDGARFHAKNGKEMKIKEIKPTNQMQTFQIQLGKPRVCFDLTWKFNQLLYSTAFGEPSS